MAVQFILGRSGTGKTRYCIDGIAADLLTGPEGPSLLLLVPEQATFQAEREILSHPRIAGYHRLHVVSFDRLQSLLLARSSVRRRLSDVGRQMVVHRILRDLAPKLRVFGSSALQPGFSSQMARTLTELHHEAHSIEDLDALIGRLDQGGQGRATAMKWADIRHVLQAYDRALQGRFLDPDVELGAARRAMAGAGWLKGVKLWVDGFSGFTGAERLLLQELVAVTSSTWITLCLDPDDLDTDPFGRVLVDPTRRYYPTEQTYAILSSGIKDAGVALGPPIVLREPLRYSRSPGLAHVEKGMGNPTGQPPPPVQHAEGKIRIWRASGPRAEVRAAARQIRRWVQDAGLRYRDIAIIVPDLDGYEPTLRAYLADLDIPFFIDRAEPLRHHPLVVLLVSALQAATTGLQTRDVMAYLKTGLVPIEPEQVSLLENYCLAFGVKGTDWAGDAPWAFDDPADPAFDEAKINAARLSAIEPLLWLKARFETKQTLAAQTFAQALQGLMDRLKVTEVLQVWIDQARQAFKTGLADEVVQAYAWVRDILEEFVEVFDGQRAGVEEWVSVMGAVLGQATLALIPPTLDQVMVGSIERSRQPDLKAVLLLGTTQRQFPMALSQAGLLTDDERQAAQAAGLSMAGGTQEALASRRYLATIAMTRGSEHLIVSYPTADEQGAALTRSSFVDELQGLFDDVTEEVVDAEPANLDQVIGPMDLADLLCARAGSEPVYADLARQVCDDPGLDSIGRLLRTALGYRNEARLDEQVASALTEGHLAGSATRLSTFAACPFKHFARYILDLQPRMEFTFEPLDLGDFYHRILDGLIKKTTATGQDLAAMDEDAVRKAAARIVQSTVEGDSFLSHFVHHSRFNEYLLRQAAATIEDCCIDVARMAGAGGFRPVLSEAGFGQEGDTLGPFEMDLPAGRTVSIRGKIDRLDKAATDAGPVALVVDYKRKKDQATFDWAEVLDGLDLQLPLYLLAVENALALGRLDARPAAAFFMRIEVEAAKEEDAGRFLRKAYGIVDGRYSKVLDSQARRDSAFYNFYVDKTGPYGNYKNRGALRPEDFEAVLRHARSTVQRLANRILSGVIVVQPAWLKGHAACERCDYLSVCRFDWQILDYRYPEPADKTRALERMGGGS